jgi:hypothetical protein
MSYDFTACKRSVDVSKILIFEILSSSSISPIRSQMSLLVGLPERSSGRVRSFTQPASSSPWTLHAHIHPGNEQ